ncbi:hypothetical protein FKP32DRAFT_1463612 [Trametes sanguinea]|nr:hypothetical protein FKP32DRAFT_1463612 [Trametes sanguinea]
MTADIAAPMETYASATPFPSARPKLPVLVFALLPDIALACVMALRPSRMVRIAMSLSLAFVAIYACATYTMGKPLDDYTTGSIVFGNMVFNALLLGCLTDPIRDFRYVRDPTPLTDKPVYARAWDAFCIIRNWRLIGMNVQVANVRPPFKGTRGQFILQGLRRIILNFLVFDMLMAFVHTHHHLYLADTAHLHFPLGPIGYVKRSACTAVHMLSSYFSMNICYLMVSVLAVGSGLWHPEDWPDLLGPASEAYTVRHLWGRVWHQLLRRHFARWGKVVVQTLHIPRGTWLSSQVQVHVAFLLSGLLHCLGDLMLGWEYLGRSMPFFLLNGIAITFEDTVIALAKRLGFGRSSVSMGQRIVGYLWVYAWMTYSVGIYTSFMWEVKMPVDDPIPSGYSPTRAWIIPLM